MKKIIFVLILVTFSGCSYPVYVERERQPVVTQEYVRPVVVQEKVSIEEKAVSKTKCCPCADYYHPRVVCETPRKEVVVIKESPVCEEGPKICFDDYQGVSSLPRGWENVEYRSCRPKVEEYYRVEVVEEEYVEGGSVEVRDYYDEPCPDLRCVDYIPEYVVYDP